MAEMVVGSLLNVAFEKIFKKLGSEFMKALNLPKQTLAKLNEWESLLPGIEALLVDAEEKLLYNPNSNNGIKEWFFEIKNLAYDIEDVLDGFEFDAIKRNLDRTPNQASTSKLIPSCFSCFKQIDFTVDSETISKVNSIDGRLQKIKQRAAELNLLRQPLSNKLHKEIDTSANRRVTTSLPEPYVYGRENEKSAILQQLLDGEGSSNGFSVVPILGMGGLGKTTLARLVFNEVKPECFELKAWVCVSDQFDIPVITRTILEAAGEKCESNDLNLLQQALNRKLSNKKFLLVLDDVWNENHKSWDELSKPFLSGAAGSKIIVTTRNERVVQVMRGNDGVHRLHLLADEHCLSIFAQIALGQNNFNQHPSLKGVGERLVKKCKGLPLAANTLGGLLRGKLDLLEWEHILKSEMWELSEKESDLLPALRLSYLYLPPYLKPCFAFSAMFPKDQKFDRNKLVSLWMAAGVLQQQSEEFGQRCFSELVSRAFLQQFHGGYSRSPEEYVMHDLIHDLAQFVAGNTSFDLDRMLGANAKSKVNFEKVRHLSFHPKSIHISKGFGFLNETKNLRTFISITSVCNRGWVEYALPVAMVSENWLPELKSLRILSLYGGRIKDLPPSVGALKGLKYLNLSATDIQTLPKSVGFLLQLQALLLRHCNHLQKIPATIGNLNSLNHLDIRFTDSLKEMPMEMCALKNLATMPKFIVGKTKETMRLFHLQNFSQLRGELSILNLHNAVDVEDARKASIGQLSDLDTLCLEWTSNFNEARNESNVELQVLNWLKPHPNLKSLKIVSYGGVQFSSWIGDALFSNVSSLELRNCKRCTSLPSLGLLPALKELTIKEMDAIEVVGEEFFGLNGIFPSLEELVFDGMKNWKEWTCSTVSGRGGEIFPCLRVLQIQNCPKLTSQLPSHLTCLVDLMIWKCPKLRSSNFHLTSFTRLEYLWISGCQSLNCFQVGSLPTTLKSLTIENCENLESLPDGILMQGDVHDNDNSLESLKMKELPSLACFGSCQLPASLKDISISGCTKLKGIPSLANLNNLDSFEIGNFESLLEFDVSTPNLTRLRIFKCKSLKYLPSTMHLMRSLQNLVIEDCPGIECIPDGSLPPNLSRLTLHCENLNSLPNTMHLLQSLSSLELIGCTNLKLFPERIHLMKSLKELRIRDGSPVLEWRNLRCLTSLKTIYISNTCIPDTAVLPSSLTSLLITNLEDQESIPRRLFQNFNCLENLFIRGCSKLNSLPKEDMPPSLTYLAIDGCPLLSRQRFEARGDYRRLALNISVVAISGNRVY